MNTFIFNSEYYVGVVQAESVEKAKELLIKNIDAQNYNFVNDPNLTEYVRLNRSRLPLIKDYEKQDLISSKAIVLGPDEALVYSHAND